MESGRGHHCLSGRKALSEGLVSLEVSRGSVGVLSRSQLLQGARVAVVTPLGLEGGVQEMVKELRTAADSDCGDASLTHPLLQAPG